MFEFSFKWTTPCILQCFIYLRRMFFSWPDLFANRLIYCLVCFVSCVVSCDCFVCRVSCDCFVCRVLCDSLSYIMWLFCVFRVSCDCFVCRVSCDCFVSVVYHVTFTSCNAPLLPVVPPPSWTLLQNKCISWVFCLLENHPIPVCICFDRFSRFIVYFNFI